VLRVLHVGKFYPPVTGGMERVVQTLCAITRGRVESRVLAFHTGRRTVDELVDGIPVTRVGALGSAGSVPVAPAFAAHLRNARADVMIVHEPNPWALLSYVIARPSIPYGIWFHSEVVRPRLQYRLFYKPVADPVYTRARRFAVSSPALADHAEALGPYRDRVVVIPFGIDASAWNTSATDRSRIERIRRNAGRPIVFFAGRLVPYKGVDVLIRAAAALDVHVTIAGAGPMRAAWERLARERSERASFEFIGEIADNELRARMHACDIFVLPSVTRAEAFGFVQLEAMACGKPVVSSRVPSGVAWVNRDGETGVVVPPGDVVALSGALTRLLADAPLRIELGRAGAARVRREFGLAQMADRFIALCEQVAAGEPVPAETAAAPARRILY
jgi:glycosyltransferase involved in cell wall biosynthesis